MPGISCDAYKCVHNCDGGCNLSSLKVDGQTHTKNCECTSCENFEEKTCACKDACTCEYPCECTDVDCSAVNCIYNDERICTADNINVGNPDSEKSCETQCDSFIKQTT